MTETMTVTTHVYKMSKLQPPGKKHTRMTKLQTVDDTYFKVRHKKFSTGQESRYQMDFLETGIVMWA
jgi:hypothetical protein